MKTSSVLSTADKNVKCEIKKKRERGIDQNPSFHNLRSWNRYVQMCKQIIIMLKKIS